LLPFYNCKPTLQNTSVQYSAMYGTLQHPQLPEPQSLKWAKKATPLSDCMGLDLLQLANRSPLPCRISGLYL